MTAKAFADTNIAIYAEGSDAAKAQRATAILESTRVISTQVVNETISAASPDFGFECAGSSVPMSFQDVSRPRH